MRKFLALIGLLIPLSGCAAVAAATGHGAPSGYHDTVLLQQSIESELDQNTVKNGTAAETGTVTNVTCVHQDGNVYACHVGWSAAPNITLKVTVADDGQSWVSTVDN